MKIFHIAVAAALLTLGGAASAEAVSAAQYDAPAPAASVQNVVFADSTPAAQSAPGANVAQLAQLAMAGEHGSADFGRPTISPMIAPSPTPLPGALWLFGSALAGFLGFSSRRKV
ncbi:hypothetical protein GCM10022279_01630 [Comamonas faecalis]|uniref:IPTL-CTERM sorting domain-containing protein n=1 Tax=Comamonas faecalis TaxID=1387849 RepID=A0ABP7QFK2_9BURK